MKLIRRIAMSSIWAPGAIPPEEWKYRNLKRVLFPVIDIFLFIGGLAAARYGVPTISEFFSDRVVDTFALVLAFIAIVCLIGVSFPRLWSVEIIGKSIVLGLLVPFTASLLIITLFDTGERAFLLMLSCIVISTIGWRLTLLGSEWQDRRNAEINLLRGE